jgi:hypothetical protein
MPPTRYPGLPTSATDNHVTEMWSDVAGPTLAAKVCDPLEDSVTDALQLVPRLQKVMGVIRSPSRSWIE